MKTLAIGIAAIVAMLGAPAIAADMALKAPPPPAPVWTWTGFYLGVEGGWNGGFGQAKTGSTPGVTNITNLFPLSGGLAGGTIGYNWQVNRFWLLGLEADGSWTNKTGASADIPPFNPNFSNQFNEQWLATFRARLGWVPAEGGLIYITGGGAAAGVQQRVFDNPPVCGVAFPCVAISQTNTLWGFAAGAGVEWRALQNLSVKAEFLYIGLQNKSYFNPAPLSPFAGFLNDQRVNLNDEVIRLGVNYHFFWAPRSVVGPY
jgi:outer membrane immunogenic protein